MSDSPFSLIAGHVALDFCNTVDWRLDPASRFERITAYDDLLAWSAAAGVLDPPEVALLTTPTLADAPARATELDRALELREAAYRVVVDHEPGAADTVRRHAREAVDVCRLTMTGTAWGWTQPHPTLATPRWRVLFALLDLVRSPAMRDVRQCADTACGWVYLDTSPRRNRRWCVAGDCGNRNRVRAHYDRRRAAARRD
ncbi:MAG: ABATE domain-containing protein [Austwickia sp.]|nr:ABATE domain-containing protein [Austwickia sp.]MBK8437471.1 ABATE domain-containing protein [Austwickia sp.]MBK9102736.1 ABATE domain-containing protein [Austwickia sp.]